MGGFINTSIGDRLIYGHRSSSFIHIVHIDSNDVSSSIWPQENVKCANAGPWEPAWTYPKMPGKYQCKKCQTKHNVFMFNLFCTIKMHKQIHRLMEFAERVGPACGYFENLLPRIGHQPWTSWPTVWGKMRRRSCDSVLGTMTWYGFHPEPDIRF